MINNFDKFPREFKHGECYFIQILNRKISGSNNKNRCIKTYYIDTQEYLEKKKEEMIQIAKASSARIYIHPARRSLKDVCIGMTGLLLEYIKNDDYHGLPRVLDSSMGKNLGVERLRIIDVDDKKRIKYIPFKKPKDI